MKLSFKIITLCILTLFSCGKPDCVNTNQVFNKYKSDQFEYKNEIERLMISDYDKIEFWLDGYVKNDSGEFIKVQISGENICAKTLVKVTDWTKLEGIQKTQGRAYSGAKLVGLKFSSKKDSTNTYFLFKDIEKVIDYD